MLKLECFSVHLTDHNACVPNRLLPTPRSVSTFRKTFQLPHHLCISPTSTIEFLASSSLNYRVIWIFSQCRCSEYLGTYIILCLDHHYLPFLDHHKFWHRVSKLNRLTPQTLDNDHPQLLDIYTPPFPHLVQNMLCTLAWVSCIAPSKLPFRTRFGSPHIPQDPPHTLYRTCCFSSRDRRIHQYQPHWASAIQHTPQGPPQSPSFPPPPHPPIRLHNTLPHVASIHNQDLSTHPTQISFHYYSFLYRLYTQFQLYST